MRINFRQGIITYPSVGTVQSFLQAAGGYVSLQCGNGRTDVAFAHLIENYLLSETVSVPNAWGPLPASTDCWLYWDINLRTAARTFGFTTVQPVYSPYQPPIVENQHWFNTSNTTMYVATAGAFRPVARVFAAKVRDGAFTPMGSGFVTKPYAGTQAGLTGQDSRVGRILVDDTGSPIRRADGRLFTTEAEIFVDGAPINVVNLEGAVVPVTAVGVLPKFHVVKFVEFGKVNLASYNDIFTSTIALLTEDLTTNQVGSVVMQGYVSNPAWNWPTLTKLWIDGFGELVDYDPHTTDPQTYPDPKPHVARVVSSTSIIFDQGMGGTGERGPASPLATTSIIGDVRLSTAPVLGFDPIAVGDNDPRMSDSRAPLSHTQPASTVLPTPYGSLTGANLQSVLVQIEDGKVAKAGGSMTGALVLSGDPTLALHATTKQYVDNTTVSLAGDTMTGVLVLSGDPTLALHAATKQYVDNTTVSLAGDTMTGPLVLSGNPTLALHAATKQYVDALDLSALVAKSGSTMTGALVLSGDPTLALHAATKQYVDNKTTPYDLTLACSDTATPLIIKSVAAWAVAARAFTITKIRADLLTTSSSGDVVLSVVLDGAAIASITLPQAAVTASVNLSQAVAAGGKLTVQIIAAGASATGLILTFTGTT